MKRIRIGTWILILLLSLTGCEQKSRLEWAKDQVCMNVEGKMTCEDGAGAIYLLRATGGNASLEKLRLDRSSGRLTFPQYGEALKIAGSSLEMKLLRDQITLVSEKQRYVDSTGIGMLLEPQADGTLLLRLPTGLPLLTRPFRFDTTGVLVGSKPPVRKVAFRKGIDNEIFLAMTHIEFIVGGDLNRYVPNDSGTEVVIIDNFQVTGDCSAEPPASCCGGSEASETFLDPSPYEASYTAIDQDLLAVFAPGSICTFTSGDKLIVLICSTNTRYCLDLSVCNVTITSTEEAICISVPTGCGMTNPF